MSQHRPNYPVNVKIPQLYVDIIDSSLNEGQPLKSAGYKGRAHFVKEAVREKLKSLGLLTWKDEQRLSDALRKGGTR